MRWMLTETQENSVIEHAIWVRLCIQNLEPENLSILSDTFCCRSKKGFSICASSFRLFATENQNKKRPVCIRTTKNCFQDSIRVHFILVIAIVVFPSTKFNVYFNHISLRVNFQTLLKFHSRRLERIASE